MQGHDALALFVLGRLLLDKVCAVFSSDPKHDGIHEIDKLLGQPTDAHLLLSHTLQPHSCKLTTQTITCFSQPGCKAAIPIHP